MLGGSAQQVIAIKTAKAMGLETVLCDFLPDNPGQFVADKYYNVSTTNVEAVYKVAKAEKVSGILAYASDPAALPAAIVADRLGLPTNLPSVVEILGVKHKFRQFLSEHGFACPKFLSFRATENVSWIKENIKNFVFPIVVKPTDSSGSKGVTLVRSFSDLERSIADAVEYSRNKILIAEEYIRRGFPDVIGGDILVWDGKIIVFGEMTCLRGHNGKGLVPIGERRPCCLSSSIVKHIHEELQRLITAVGVSFGELNIEIILDDKNDVHFLELGPRAGGNMIPVQLSDALGVDLVKANVAMAMGEKPKIDIHERPGYFVTYVLHSDKEGVLGDVNFSKELRPYIYRKVLYKDLGDKVEAFRGAGNALGILFLHFDTEEQMNNYCSQMEKHVELVLI